MKKVDSWNLPLCFLSGAKLSVNLLEKVCSCARKRGCAVKRECTIFTTFTIFIIFLHKNSQMRYQGSTVFDLTKCSKTSLCMIIASRIYAL